MMNFSDLISFCNRNQKQLVEALPRGIHALARVMRAGADEFDMIQKIDGEYLCWETSENELFLMFCIIPDPRDLDRVLDAYVQTKEKQCPFTGILVHQWIDGEGTWDAFLITEQYAMQHGGRLSGSDVVQERGPQLRMDTYTLFDSDKEFPEPGEDQWIELLAGPVEGVVEQLGVLAKQHNCTQVYEDYLVQWKNPKGQLEVQFFLFPDQKDITPFIYIYQHLKKTPCPVSFVFVECEQAHLRDIFRLSARSYLEHHNRPGYVCSEEREPTSQQFKGDSLDNSKAIVAENNVYRDGSKVWISGIQGWSPSEKVSSVHAVSEAVARALGEEFSYEYLVGLSSLAFRMQVGGLCPSSPHPGCGYPCVRSRLVPPWKFKEYEIDQNKRNVPQELFDIIVKSINSGIPVRTGEEEDGLIIGYNTEKIELTCLHPWHFDGKKPFVIGLNSLRKICWCIGVYTERTTATIDEYALVVDSLRQAVDMAKKGKVEGYAVGFKAWEAYISTLQALDKTKRNIPESEMLGNAWIYECLVQYRQIAAKYLNMIEDQFDETYKKHLKMPQIFTDKSRKTYSLATNLSIR